VRDVSLLERKEVGVRVWWVRLGGDGDGNGDWSLTMRNDVGRSENRAGLEHRPGGGARPALLRRSFNGAVSDGGARFIGTTGLGFLVVVIAMVC
jgi:hypothetical protein